MRLVGPRGKQTHVVAVIHHHKVNHVEQRRQVGAAVAGEPFVHEDRAAWGFRELGFRSQGGRKAGRGCCAPSLATSGASHHKPAGRPTSSL